MKTKNRRVSSNIDEIDPIENMIMRHEYEEDRKKQVRIAKANQEDKASMSDHLLDKTQMKKQSPSLIDDMQNNMQNRYPEDRATRLKQRSDTYPAQKFKKIQVTPGKWKTVPGNTWSVD